MLERRGPAAEKDESEAASESEEVGADEQETEQVQIASGETGLETVISKEIFLIRRASDNTGGIRSVGASYVGSGGWADGASRLAQGIGVDTRRYIEGLLSLNR